MSTYDPDLTAATLLHPLADAERRVADPIRALEAAHDLTIMLNLGSLGAATAARAQGRSWAEIGDALGVTRQAAQQRFGIWTDPDSALVLPAVPAP